MKRLFILVALLTVLLAGCAPIAIGTSLGTVVYTLDTQTLTNKTLTTPVIGQVYQDAYKDNLLTLPAATGTMATQEWVIANSYGPGNVWYADNTTGTDAGAGTSWATATKTIEEAVLKASSGDTIFILGSFNENVTLATTAIRLIGVGSTTAQALWTAPTDNVCLTITAADCVVKNIRFRPPAYGSGTPAAISLSGAYQTIIQGCRFQGKSGSWYGILTDGTNANVRILDDVFYYMNTATNGTAIKGYSYAVGEDSGWLIQGCQFDSNTNHIVCRFRQSVIQNNVFAAYGLKADNSMGAPTVGVNISGSAYGANLVTQNTFGTPYTTALYTSATNDNWVGNYTYSSVTAPYGLSIGVPGGT